MTHIPFSTLYTADHGWLKTRFHFSFAEYHNRDNMHYGVLRVMNDELIGARINDIVFKEGDAVEVEMAVADSL